MGKQLLCCTVGIWSHKAYSLGYLGLLKLEVIRLWWIWIDFCFFVKDVKVFFSIILVEEDFLGGGSCVGWGDAVKLLLCI